VRLHEMAPDRVLLIGKPACHLCDDARAVVSDVCGRLGVGWQELSIFDDPALYDEYWERIPVTVVDGRVVDYWRIDPTTLEHALIGQTSEKRT
jgi:hypothetical protein